MEEVMDPVSLMMGAAGIGANLFGQSETNQMQAQMMQQQEQFQQSMSNTAYQRATADMKAAGLNPMMMFSSGSAASTPSGPSPSPMVKSGLNGDAIQTAVNSAVQSKVANATIDKLSEEISNIKADTITKQAQPALVKAETGKTVQDTKRSEAETWDAANRAAADQYKIPIVRNEAITAANQERMNSSARSLLDQGALVGRRASDTLSPVSDIIGSASKAKWLMRGDW